MHEGTQEIRRHASNILVLHELPCGAAVLAREWRFAKEAGITRRMLVRALARGKREYSSLFAAAAVFVALALLIEGSRPAARLPLEPGLPHFDKFLHFAAHFVLASLLVWAAALAPQGRPALRLKSAALGALVADVALGVAVELTQLWLGRAHGRQFEMWDVAANTTGAIAAIMAFLMVVRMATRPYIKERKSTAEP